MSDFIAYFTGRSTYYEDRGKRSLRYLMCSKDYAIREAKKDASEMDAVEFSLYYNTASMKPVGSWELKGSRWYRM